MAGGFARKYVANFSTSETPGSAMRRRAILRIVLIDTPLPLATTSQVPLVASKFANTNSCNEPVMGSESKSCLGLSQTRIGGIDWLSSNPVSRRTKKDKGPSALRALVADTVKTLRDKKYKTLPNLTARNKQLATDAELSYSQILRVTKGSLGASVDTIEALARALGVRPEELLTPYFALKKPEAETKHQEPRLLRRGQGV